MEYLLAALIPIWTIEKFGRRNLLLISATGQMISMMILSGAIWYVTERPGTAGSFTMGIVAVVCFFLFNTFYAQGFLAIPFFYPAEISNLRTISRAVSISVMSNWLFTFLVVMITPVATTNIGWRYATSLILCCNIKYSNITAEPTLSSLCSTQHSFPLSTSSFLKLQGLVWKPLTPCLITVE